MSIERIGTADNREEWLELRKSYLTASSICAWRGPDHLPPKYAWYFEQNTREAILREKLEGWEKPFTREAEVSMAHGREDEEHILWKVGEELGAYTEADNSMFVNDRWPHLAATVDGFIHRPTAEPKYMFGQDQEQAERAYNGLLALPEGMATVLEIKKSVSVGWARGEVPPYYVTQVQTQLHILDLPFGLIAAECLYKDPVEKWRLYWDLRPTIIERDPRWADVLDQCNAEFKAALDNAA